MSNCEHEFHYVGAKLITEDLGNGYCQDKLKHVNYCPKCELQVYFDSYEEAVLPINIYKLRKEYLDKKKFSDDDEELRKIEHNAPRPQIKIGWFL